MPLQDERIPEMPDRDDATPNPLSLTESSAPGSAGALEERLPRKAVVR